jgi:hypothetical protein
MAGAGDMKLNPVVKVLLSFIGLLILIIGLIHGNNLILCEVGFLIMGIAIGAEVT